MSESTTSNGQLFSIEHALTQIKIIRYNLNVRKCKPKEKMTNKMKVCILLKGTNLGPLNLDCLIGFVFLALALTISLDIITALGGYA